MKSAKLQEQEYKKTRNYYFSTRTFFIKKKKK